MWYSSSEFASLEEPHRPSLYRFLLASVQDEEVAVVDSGVLPKWIEPSWGNSVRT